jgi:hypothetical protein
MREHAPDGVAFSTQDTADERDDEAAKLWR